MKLFAVTLLLVVGLAGGRPRSLAAQTTVDEARAQIVAANDRELEAVMAGDAAEAASYFLEDALLLPPDGSLIQGRAAIQEFWTPQPGSRITAADTEVERFDVRDDLAYLVGSYELDTLTDGEAATARGRFFMIWRRTPEGWRIEVDMWN